MGLASLLGLLLCFGMCAFGMIQSAGLAHINRYLDLPSMIITFGGSFFAILMGSTLKDYIGGLKSFTLIFKAPDLDAKSMIQKIIDLSNVARKEGLLSLEEAAGNLDDDKKKKKRLINLSIEYFHRIKVPKNVYLSVKNIFKINNNYYICCCKSKFYIPNIIYFDLKYCF